jgi:hypothetical protein
MLDEIGPHENDLNFLIGWSMYFVVMLSYGIAVLGDSGAPPDYLKFYRSDLEV